MRYEIKLKTIRIKIKEENIVSSESLITPEHAVKLLKGIYRDLDADQEHFGVLFLNSQNQIIGFKILFSGGQNFSQMDMKILFRNILLFGATAVIIFHNHPSGNPKPSEEDKLITERIKKGCDLLEIILLDHIIITTSGENFYSFKENRLL